MMTLMMLTDLQTAIQLSWYLMLTQVYTNIQKDHQNGASYVIDNVWRITLAIAEIAHDIIDKKTIGTTRQAIVRQIFDVCSKVSKNCVD